MQTHEIIAVAAALLALSGAVPYVLDTLRGRTRPNRATWMVYAVVGSLAVISSYAAGGRWSLLTAAAYAIGPLAILLASIRHGEGGWSRLDRACLGIAAGGVAGWAITGDPRVGVVLHTIADAAGTVPTWIKSWRDPAHENRRAWTIYAVAATLNLGAITAWTIGEALFSVWLALCCVSVALILWIRPLRGSPRRTRPDVPPRP
jgi:hypothetical protein